MGYGAMEISTTKGMKTSVPETGSGEITRGHEISTMGSPPPLSRRKYGGGVMLMYEGNYRGWDIYYDDCRELTATGLQHYEIVKGYVKIWLYYKTVDEVKKFIDEWEDDPLLREVRE